MPLKFYILGEFVTFYLTLTKDQDSDNLLMEFGKFKQYRAPYKMWDEKGIELAMDGQVDATVTAPISKEAINMAGHKFSGHTEIYA